MPMLPSHLRFEKALVAKVKSKEREKSRDRSLEYEKRKIERLEKRGFRKGEYNALKGRWENE